MPTIFPIPTGRSSDLLVQRRLLAQYQADQLDLLRIQSQIGSGRRISRPSEDPAAAARGIEIQRLLEQKTQVKTNLNTSQSYLAASDNAISGLSKLLAEIHGLAVSSAQTTNSDQQREVHAEEVNRAIQRLVDIGNQRFRGRYLFAGSTTTVLPFETSGSNVIFHGNETDLRSYGDVDFLVASNVRGNDVFGAISPEVRGSTDLNPNLTAGTRLSDLRGGQGVTKGTFVISDGTSQKTIDISSAETIGDLARLITANPPTGRAITALVTPVGLTIDIDDAGGGNLTITESGNGTTAAELGIKNTLGTLTNPIVGTDLDPRMTLTTQLAELLGTRPTVTVASSGQNNDLIVDALQNGTAYDGVTIQFVDDAKTHAAASLTAGNETVSYSATAVAARAALHFSGFNNNILLTGNTPGTTLNNVRIDLVNAGPIGSVATVNYNAGTKVLTLGIDGTSVTSAQTLINAINAEGTFTASADTSDPADGGFAPGAALFAVDARTSFGNTSNSGGNAKTLFVNINLSGTTANDVIQAINQDPTVGLLFAARLDDLDTSNDVNAGLGLVAVNATGLTAGGSGESLDQTSGLRVVHGAQTYTIDISAAKTVEDLLNIINSAGAHLVASINANGAGIDLRSRLSGADLSIGENGGQTATQLGVRSLAASTRLADLNYGRGVGSTAGTDFTLTRTDGVVLNIDISAAATVGDVLDLINAAGGVTASLAAIGNGIVIRDDAAGPGTLTVTKQQLSSAAWDLGLIPLNQVAATGSGAPPTVLGADVNPLEVKGAFTSLIRLQKALELSSEGEIERAASMLNDDLQRANFSRAELGTRQQGLDALKIRLDEEEVELKSTLTNEIDVDLPEAISNLVARQASLEASLRLTAKVFQLSLLDFL